MQDILVYLIVAGAAFYLGKTLWTAANGSKGGCGGGCGSGCGSKTPVKPTASSLVQIQINTPDTHSKK